MGEGACSRPFYKNGLFLFPFTAFNSVPDSLVQSAAAAADAAAEAEAEAEAEAQPTRGGSGGGGGGGGNEV